MARRPRGDKKAGSGGGGPCLMQRCHRLQTELLTACWGVKKTVAASLVVVSELLDDSSCAQQNDP